MNKKILLSLIAVSLVSISGIILGSHKCKSKSNKYKKKLDPIQKKFENLKKRIRKCEKKEIPKIIEDFKALAEESNQEIRIKALYKIVKLYDNSNNNKKALYYANKVDQEPLLKTHLTSKQIGFIYLTIGSHSKKTTLAIDRLQQATKIYSKQAKKYHQANDKNLEYAINKLFLSTNELGYHLFKKAKYHGEKQEPKKAKKYAEQAIEQIDKAISYDDEYLDAYDLYNKIQAIIRKADILNHPYTLNNPEKAIIYYQQANKKIKKHKDTLNGNDYIELDLNNLRDLIITAKKLKDDKITNKYEKKWKQNGYDTYACAICKYYGPNLCVCQKRYCQDEPCKSKHIETHTQKNICNTYGHQKEYQSKACANCGKTQTKLNRCGRCHSVFYCSKECQIKDWKNHKKNCKE